MKHHSAPRTEQGGKVARQQQLQSIALPAQYLLRLYVAGNSRLSIQAIKNIKTICEEHLKDCYQLEVIDLYQQPERAKKDQIIAIPTLIKELPLPQCRIIGDLSNSELVCEVLDIRGESKLPGSTFTKNRFDN